VAAHARVTRESLATHLAAAAQKVGHLNRLPDDDVYLVADVWHCSLDAQYVLHAPVVKRQHDGVGVGDAAQQVRKPRLELVHVPILTHAAFGKQM
jgi:hypothetical protein